MSAASLDVKLNIGDKKDADRQLLALISTRRCNTLQTA
jgi:hypothetical protein